MTYRRLGVVALRLARILREARFPITSWYEFAELREQVRAICDLTRAQVYAAIAYGVKERYLKPRWAGVGMTPWAGSARRARMYERGDEQLIAYFLQRADLEAKTGAPAQ